MKKLTYFVILLNFILSSCTNNTNESTYQTNKILPNGKHLVVEKIDKKTTSKGFITNHVYGVSHSFKYNVFITQNKIKWNAGSGDPKNILFCNGDTYIRYLKEKSIKTEYLDTVNNVIKNNYHSETCEVFQKHIDNRYFFKLLGTDFWEDISSDTYLALKNNCDHYSIPNDNELKLTIK